MVNAGAGSPLGGGDDGLGSLTPELREKWRRWERLHAERLRLVEEAPTVADDSEPGDEGAPDVAAVPAGPPAAHPTQPATPSGGAAPPPPDGVREPDPPREPAVPASVAMAERLRAEVMRLEEERRSLEEERQRLSAERTRLEQERAAAARAAAEASSAAAEAAQASADARRVTRMLQGATERQQPPAEAGRVRWSRWLWRQARGAPPG